MAMAAVIRIETLHMRGEQIQGLSVPELVLVLDNLPARLVAPDARILSAGRNLTVVIPVSVAGQNKQWAVKRFPPSFARSPREGKAWDSWDASLFLRSNGVPVPAPVAILETKAGVSEAVSYFITEFLPERYTFKDELIRIYRDGLECETLMTLLELVARNIRQMHDAGFLHNDLGNQNILLARKGDRDWESVEFIDLNRGRIRDGLSVRYLVSEPVETFLDQTGLYRKAFKKGD